MCQLCFYTSSMVGGGCKISLIQNVVRFLISVCNIDNFNEINVLALEWEIHICVLKDNTHGRYVVFFATLFTRHQTPSHHF